MARFVGDMTRMMDSAWAWVEHSDIIFQIMLCAGICCCMSCLLICCKQCCCYNTCGPHRKRKREKIIIKIKEPEIPKPKRKPSQEGKLSSQLKENQNSEEDMDDSLLSAIQKEGQFSRWVNIVKALSAKPAHYEVLSDDSDNEDDESICISQLSKSTTIQSSMQAYKIRPGTFLLSVKY